MANAESDNWELKELNDLSLNDKTDNATSSSEAEKPQETTTTDPTS